jgi:hypothetical protein
MVQIAAGIRKYSLYSFKNSIKTSLNAGIDNNLLKQFKTLLYSIIQEYLEDSLATLNTGREYLA